MKYIYYIHNSLTNLGAGSCPEWAVGWDLVLGACTIGMTHDINAIDV